MVSMFRQLRQTPRVAVFFAFASLRGLALGRLGLRPRLLLALLRSAGLQERVVLQFRLDPIQQLRRRELQDLHGLDHLRRLLQTLFQPQVLGIFQAH